MFILGVLFVLLIPTGTGYLFRIFFPANFKEPAWILFCIGLVLWLVTAVVGLLCALVIKSIYDELVVEHEKNTPHNRPIYKSKVRICSECKDDEHCEVCRFYDAETDT